MENSEERFVENFDGVKWEEKENRSFEEVKNIFQDDLRKQATKKYVPIGTIIGISGNNNKYMIIGFNSKQEDGTLKDYIICGYPLGVNTNNNVFSINHEEISRIYHIGYFDLMGRNLQSELNGKEHTL